MRQLRKLAHEPAIVERLHEVTGTWNARFAMMPPTKRWLTIGLVVLLLAAASSRKKTGA